MFRLCRPCLPLCELLSLSLRLRCNERFVTNPSVPLSRGMDRVSDQLCPLLLERRSLWQWSSLSAQERVEMSEAPKGRRDSSEALQELDEICEQHRTQARNRVKSLTSSFGWRGGGI